MFMYHRYSCIHTTAVRTVCRPVVCRSRFVVYFSIFPRDMLPAFDLAQKTTPPGYGYPPYSRIRRITCSLRPDPTAPPPHQPEPQVFSPVFSPPAHTAPAALAAPAAQEEVLRLRAQLAEAQAAKTAAELRACRAEPLGLAAILPVHLAGTRADGEVDRELGS